MYSLMCHSRTLKYYDSEGGTIAQLYIKLLLSGHFVQKDNEFNCYGHRYLTYSMSIATVINFYQEKNKLFLCVYVFGLMHLLFCSEESHFISLF